MQLKKLKAISGGDWSLAVCTVKRSFFRSREALKNIMLSRNLRGNNDICQGFN